MKTPLNIFIVAALCCSVAACKKKVVVPPNQPPSSTCTADRATVYAGSGDKVGVTARASDPESDTLNYAWNASGGAIEGSGATVQWNSAGTALGSYSITAAVDDGKGGTTTCEVSIGVVERPNQPPTLSCSAARSSVLAGERVAVSGRGSDADGDTLTYSWRANAGQIVGTGASVQFDTSGLSAGSYSITGRVEDSRGGAADCSVQVSVQEPPPPPQASKLNELFFRRGSGRVDNIGKRVLDDIVLRLKNEPSAKVVLVGYADPREPRPDRLAGQRADIAKKYIVDGGIDAARVEVRTGTGQAGAGDQNRRVDIIWVPQGATY